MLKWRISEDSAEISTLSDNMDVIHEFSDDFRTRIQAVVDAVDSGELDGASYNAAKNVFVKFYLPIATALDNLANDIEGSISSYKASRSGMSGIDEIDEAKVLISIAQLTATNLFLEGSASVTDVAGISNLAQDKIQSNNEKKKVLNKHIDELHDFDSATNSTFSSYASVLSNIMKGIQYVNDGSLSIDGTYTAPKGESSDWLGVLNKYSKGSKNAAEIQNYEDAYDLTAPQARMVMKLERKLDAYGKKHRWSTQKINYEFARIIASTSYAGLQWEIAAGVYSRTEELKVLKEIGFSEAAARTLRGSLRKANKDINGNKKSVNDFVHAMASLAVILNPNVGSKSVLRLGTGINVFAFTSPATNVFSFAKASVTDENVKSAATYRADIASGSISKADLNADIDAINLFNRLDSGASITTVMNEYANSLKDGGNRAREIAQSLGNGDEKAGKKKFVETLNETITDPADLFQEIKGSNMLSTKDDAEKMVKWYDEEYKKK